MICALLQIAGQVKCRAFEHHDWRLVRVTQEGHKIRRCRRCGREIEEKRTVQGR